jgi:hypothetical protein
MEADYHMESQGKTIVVFVGEKYKWNYSENAAGAFEGVNGI